MIVFLRGLFVLVILSMLAVTTWASSRCALFAVPPAVIHHPWFIATLFDTYWAFLTFYAWTCYKRTALAARLSWLVAILLLGNIAMASFCLRELFRVPADAKLADVLTSRRPGWDWLGTGLAAAGAAVVGVGLAR
jgi:hypothetical protein